MSLALRWPRITLARLWGAGAHSLVTRLSHAFPGNLRDVLRVLCRVALACVAVLILSPAGVRCETLTLAFYNTELARDGPGLLLRDLARGDDAQGLAVAQVVAACAPDVLVLSGIDYDADLAALGALNALIAARGLVYPHLFAARPNAGMATGLDLDGNGRLGEARDAQGYGRFAGQGGLAVLSRYPLRLWRDLSDLLWRDVPDSLLIDAQGRRGDAATGAGQLRLSTNAHWVLELATQPTVRLLVFHAGPPVFDGPEDRNGRRNHDEVALWRHLLDGRLGDVPPAPHVLLGDANLDPQGGAGRREAIRALLADPRLADPAPARGPRGCAPGRGPPAPTVDWPEPVPGDLRVDYVLPGAGLAVQASGVAWPPPGDPLAEAVAAASRHRLVWVRLAWPP